MYDVIYQTYSPFKRDVLRLYPHAATIRCPFPYVASLICGRTKARAARACQNYGRALSCRAALCRTTCVEIARQRGIMNVIVVLFALNGFVWELSCMLQWQFALQFSVRIPVGFCLDVWCYLLPYLLLLRAFYTNMTIDVRFEYRGKWQSFGVIIKWNDLLDYLIFWFKNKPIYLNIIKMF